MKSSLLPVNPGTSTADPMALVVRAASLSRAAKDPRPVAMREAFTPKGGAMKGGMLTPGRIGCGLTGRSPTRARDAKEAT